MNDNSYINWVSMSDAAVAKTIGSFIKHQRTEQNHTQEELAKAAGISRSTLSLLERGEPVTLLTLLQVLRTINSLDVLNSFIVNPQISPMLVAEAQQQKRYRVRKKKSKTPPKDDSSW